MELIDAKTIVTRNKVIQRDYLAAEYTMNIYKGCCHGCIYCDSRSDCYKIDNFDQVKAKRDALRIIRDDLRRKVKPGAIITGGMSDSYNPYEKDMKLTRNALELIHAFSFGVLVLTKSTLVTRDVEIFKDIKEHSPVAVNITITSAFDEISREIEPHVMPSTERFAAIKELTEQGIFAGILMAPILPYITDTEENIKEMVYQAHACGANYIYCSPAVTLRGNQREWFYQKIDHLYPGLSDKYRKRYDERYVCNSPKAKKLMDVFRRECEKYGMVSDMRKINQMIRAGYSVSGLSRIPFTP